MRDGISVWFSERENRWVFQVTYKDQTGKVRKIQRRAKSEREAHIRANDLARSSSLKNAHLKKPKFDQLLEQYAKFKASKMLLSSLANNLHILKLYASPFFKDLRVDQITPDQVANWMDALEGRGLKTQTINTARSKLSAILNFACQKKYVESNPVAYVPRHHQQPGAPTQVQSPWDLYETRQALRAFKGHLLEPFVVLGITTGMRKGEILGLRWSDIDFANSQIRVRRSRGERRVAISPSEFVVRVEDGPTKTASSLRSLPLTPVLREVLEGHQKYLQSIGQEVSPNSYVICSASGTPLSPSHLGKVFRRVLEKNNIRKIRIHDLRHTAAVLALEAGVPLEAISQGLGHQGVEITKRTYAPVVPALSDRFVNQISEILK